MDQYRKIVRLKERDKALQLFSLPVTVLLFFMGGHLFSLYLIAAVQCVSCLFWQNYFRSAGDALPQMKAGIRIRKTFLVVMIVHGICLILLPLFLFLAVVMLLAGPILGIAYFLIGLEETEYYNKMQLPSDTPARIGYEKTDPDISSSGSHLQ